MIKIRKIKMIIWRDALLVEVKFARMFASSNIHVPFFPLRAINTSETGAGGSVKDIFFVTALIF